MQRERLKRNWKSPLRIIGFSFSSIKFEYFPVLLQIFERKHNAASTLPKKKILKMWNIEKRELNKKLIFTKKKVWIRKLKENLCCFRPACGASSTQIACIVKKIVSNLWLKHHRSIALNYLRNIYQQILYTTKLIWLEQENNIFEPSWRPSFNSFCRIYVVPDTLPASLKIPRWDWHWTLIRHYELKYLIIKLSPILFNNIRMKDKYDHGFTLGNNINIF